MNFSQQKDGAGVGFMSLGIRDRTGSNCSSANADTGDLLCADRRNQVFARFATTRHHPTNGISQSKFSQPMWCERTSIFLKNGLALVNWVAISLLAWIACATPPSAKSRAMAK